MRSVHESKEHEDNCFITLTYDDKNLPEDRCITKRDMQLFIKRLRKKYAKPIRYFGCGEYGDENARPHYHINLFGHNFEDSELWDNNNDRPHYRSEQLESIWTFGFSTVAPFSFDTAAYTARYVTKKHTGPQAEDAYEYVDKATGQIFVLEPEFALMSRMPGIGKNFFKKYHGDIYPKDFTTMRGVKMRPTKYYDTLMEQDDPEQMAKIKGKRKEVQNRNLEEQWHERQTVKEKCKKAQIKTLTRRYEK